MSAYPDSSLRDPAHAPARGGVRENADVDASSEHYARRFHGSVGHWFLNVQTRHTLGALAGLPVDATVLDVGGGHAQVAPPLVEAGYRVTVVGSDPSCGERLRPWTSTRRCRFDVADLQLLPYADAAFDAVVCYRMLAHSVDWTSLVRELCRVAAHRVVIDYPSRRSVNIVSQELFDLKRSIEGSTTRQFALYHPRQVAAAFNAAGFQVVNAHPQFLMPMVLYRLARSAAFGRAVEWAGRATGLTRALGSPVIVRADRRTPT